MADNRGSGEIAGLLSLGVVALVGYGLWVGGERLWHEFRDDGPPAMIECRSGAQTVYQGLAKHGIHKSGDRMMLVDISGAEVSIDGAAVCVSTVYPIEKPKAAQANFKTSTGSPQ